MPDLPDYTRQMVLRYEGGFIGLEELAARLGSVVPWDLQGNILLAENFESEETEYELYAETVASTATRSSRHKFLGDWGIKLTTANAVDEYTCLAANILGPTTGKVAVFALLGLVDPVREILITANTWDGTTYHHPALKYTRTTQVLAILDEGEVWRTVAGGLILGTAAFRWYPFRLDFDLATGYYHKAYVAGVEYDLSGYANRGTATTGPPRINTVISNYAIAGVGSTVYLDSLVIAKNIQ